MNFLGNLLYEALVPSRIEATLGCGFQDKNEAQLLNGPVKNRMKMPGNTHMVVLGRANRMEGERFRKNAEERRN